MAENGERPIDIGHELRYWLGLVCRELREKAEAPRIAIAYAAGVDPKTIERHEDGETLAGVDRKLAGYAHVLGIEDYRDLYVMAIAEWQQRGEILVLDDPGAPETKRPQLAREILQARQAAARALQPGRAAAGNQVQADRDRPRVAGRGKQ